MRNGSDASSVARSSVNSCVRHPDTRSLAPCGGCRTNLCDECATHWVDDRVHCAACANRARREGRARWDLAVAFLLSGAAVESALWSWDRTLRSTDAYVFTVVAGFVMMGVAIYLLLPRGQRRDVRRRDGGPGQELEVLLDAGPYRGARVRVPTSRGPRLSARATSMVLVGSFVATALALPLSLHLPRWVETEVVLCAWALLLFGALATFLYRGWRLRDDHALLIDFDRLRLPNPAPRKPRIDWSLSLADADGCMYVIALGLVCGVVFAIAFIVTELVFPLVFFVAYSLVVRAIERVMRDRHDCRDRLARSLAWGGLWTAIYFGPLAALIWTVHAISQVR